MMGSVKMVFMLSIIAATLAFLSADYAGWVSENPEISDNFEECTEVKASEDIFTILSPNEQRGIVGLDCGESGGPDWFFLIWLVPLAITMLYIFTPFVK